MEKSIRNMRTLKAKNRDNQTKPTLIDSLIPLVGEIENWKVQRDVTSSIERYGLLEPLSVLEVEDSLTGLLYLRVDKGCNRYRAAQELGYTHIDCNLYETWDELFEASEIGRKRSKVWRR